MTLDEIWTLLESDTEWRQAEMRMLSNSLDQFRRREDRDKFRRVMVVMLYAHVEGFFKVAFSTYVQFINWTAPRCSDVVDCIAAASFEDVFHALAYGDKKGRVFKSNPPSDEKLLAFARRQEFFGELQRLLNRSIRLPEDVVNTENNLRASTLRRNLFRLGFAVDLLDKHESSLDELVNRRNNIAHGSDNLPVREVEYERLRKAAFDAMDEITLAIVHASENRLFVRDATVA
jgi:hypothetical protein